MKRIFFLLIAALTFTACSSDDPKADEPGGGGTGKDPLNIEGKWLFDKWSLTLEVDDPETKKAIQKIFDDRKSNDMFPKAGFLNFKTETYFNNSPDFVEGSLYASFESATATGYFYADYYTKGDTIFYHYVETASGVPGNGYWDKPETWKFYYLKKGNKIYYNSSTTEYTDATEYYQKQYPQGGVKKVIFNAEYKKQ